MNNKTRNKTRCVTRYRIRVHSTCRQSCHQLASNKANLCTVYRNFPLIPHTMLSCNLEHPLSKRFSSQSVVRVKMHSYTIRHYYKIMYGESSNGAGFDLKVKIRIGQIIELSLHAIRSSDIKHGTLGTFSV